MINNSKKQDYILGIDLGVESIGWAAVINSENDNKYELVTTRNGNPAWGVIEFEKAKTAQQRRMFRGTRRLVRRRKKRLAELQKLFNDYAKTNNQKSVENETLNQFIAKQYREKYPTIYHLQQDLYDQKIDFENSNIFDSKLKNQIIYLSLHNLFKHRGHFLSGTTKKIGITSDEEHELETLLQNLELSNPELHKVIIKEDYSKRLNDKKGFKRDEISTKIMKFVEQEKKLSFKDEEINDQIEIINHLELKRYIEIMYFRYINAMTQELTYKNENEAYKTFIHKKVAHYEHAKITIDLFKQYIQEPIKKEFIKNPELIEVFLNRNSDQKLVFYKSNKKKYIPTEMGIDIKDFTSYVLSKELPNDYIERYERVKGNKDIFEIFTAKNRSAELNQFIPIFETAEIVQKIIDNYYFENNATTKQFKLDIIDLLKFKIPYYIGPISEKNENSNDRKFSWVIKKPEYKDEVITYKNYKYVIDEIATAKEFINRMRGNCTYLPSKKAASINSITYQKFNILNELNNIKYKEKYLSGFSNPISFTPEEKLAIIDKIFTQNKTVTFKKSSQSLKTLLTILEKPNLSAEEIIFTGFQDENNTFMSTYSTFIDFHKISPELTSDKNLEAAEEIIEVLTALPNDEEEMRKQSVKLICEKANINLSDAQIIKLVRKAKFTGFSSLSLDLIAKNKYNGLTIIEHLIDTNHNFQKILSFKSNENSDYKIRDLIASENFGSIEGISIKNLTEKLEELIPNNPAIRKSVKIAIKAINEIIKNIGNPQKIILESTRENSTKSEIPKSILKEIAELEKNILKNKSLKIYTDKKEKNSKLSNRNKAIKYRLYLEQQGKCLYTENPINLENLFEDNQYQIDHIFPQSKKYTNSQNKIALVTTAANSAKGDKLLYEYLGEKFERRKKFWQSLNLNKIKLETLCISSQKEVDQELEKMIQRSLVETSQIVLNVKNILENIDFIKKAKNKIKVELVKSKIVSILKNPPAKIEDQKIPYKRIPKNRGLTPQHHAIDAMFTAISDIEILSKYKENNENNNLQISTFSMLLTNFRLNIQANEILRKNIDKKWFYVNHLAEYNKDKDNLMQQTIESSNKLKYHDYFNQLIEKINKQGKIKNKTEIINEIEKGRNKGYNIPKIIFNIVKNCNLTIEQLIIINDKIFSDKELYILKDKKIIGRYSTLTVKGVLAKVDKNNKLEKIFVSVQPLKNEKALKLFVSQNSDYEIITRNTILAKDEQKYYIQSMTEVKSYSPLVLSYSDQLNINNLLRSKELADKQDLLDLLNSKMEQQLKLLFSPLRILKIDQIGSDIEEINDNLQKIIDSIKNSKTIQKKTKLEEGKERIEKISDFGRLRKTNSLIGFTVQTKKSISGIE